MAPLNSPTTKKVMLAHHGPRLRATPLQLFPYLLHFAMVVSVAVYVLVGAYAIRRIEARRISDHTGPSVGWGRKGGFKSSKSDASVEVVPRSRRSLVPAIDHSALTRFKS